MRAKAQRAAGRPARVSRETSLADAEGRKQPIENVLDVDPPGDLANGAQGEPRIFGCELALPGGKRRRGPLQGIVGAGQGGAMALAGDDAVTLSERRLRFVFDAPQERLEPGAGHGGDGELGIGGARRKDRPWWRRVTTAAPAGAASRASGATSHSVRSAVPSRARVRCMPACSIGSAEARKPAVSTKVTGNPPRSQRTSMASRVVPGTAETIATSRWARALRSVDLPAFGGPASTTTKPSRRRSPRCAVGQGRGDLPLQIAERCARLRFQMRRHVALVGEIERGFETRQGGDEPLAPALDKAAESAFKLTEGLAPLRLRFGVDQIGQALDAAEIHPAVEKGAAGEFAGLRCAAAVEGAERPQHRRAHGKAAVQVQLRLVLAGKAVRARHPGDQRLVEHLARARIA